MNDQTTFHDLFNRIKSDVNIIKCYSSINNRKKIDLRLDWLMYTYHKISQSLGILLHPLQFHKLYAILQIHDSSYFPQ